MKVSEAVKLRVSQAGCCKDDGDNQCDVCGWWHPHGTECGYCAVRNASVDALPGERAFKPIVDVYAKGESADWRAIADARKAQLDDAKLRIAWLERELKLAKKSK